jgi:membrane fusion protein, copper/silver efflux system
MNLSPMPATALLCALIAGCGAATPPAAPPPASASASDAHAEHEGLPEGRVSIAVDPDWASRLGLRTEAALRESFTAQARAVASVVPDEDRVLHIHARVAGWVERMHVSHTGQELAAGAPVASIWSQELFAAQTEYLQAYARSGAGPASAIAAGSRERLRALGMSEAQIVAIERRGEPMRTVAVHTPRAGVVLRRPVAAGTAVDPSTELLTLADLSRLWIVADLAERDAELALPGAAARVVFDGLPAQDLVIDFVAPTVDPRSRTLRVRATVDNRDGRLRPGMAGSLDLWGASDTRITVPRDAVVDDGRRALVYVQREDARFEPREVRIGSRRGERIAVLEGLAEGEPVLVSGVFLVDSESRLQGSGGAGLHGHGGDGAVARPREDADPHRGHR